MSQVYAALNPTTYAYDANGNRTSVTNPRGKTTTYAYDALNRVTSTTDPNNRTASFQYDVHSRVTQRSDARGLVTKYFYDATDRLTRAEHWNGSTFVDQVTYAYDALGNRTQMVDPTGTTAYAYDALNRATSITFPGSKVVSYQYDNAGRRTRITYPDGKTVDYGYDAASNLTSVTDWAGRVTTYGFDNVGNLNWVSLPPSARLMQGYSYDNADRLSCVGNYKDWDWPSYTLVDYYCFGLDAIGNRTSMSTTAGTAYYTYDNLQRLTSVTYPGPTTDTYTYDANGNRLTKNSTSYTYDNADQMTSAGGVSYGYDNNGNQTSRGSDTFAWDFENRMTSATVAGAATTYAYNGDGLRQSRASGGVTSSYTWDVNRGLPVILQDTTGSATTTYVYGLGMLYWVDGSGNPTYRLTDGLGSTANLANGSGTVTDTYTYDVFGAVRTHTGSNGTEFTFTGEQNDPNGLEYLRARYYDPASGRFLGRDPLGGGYPYAGGNPVNRIDPSGLYPICFPVGSPDGEGCYDSTEVGLPPVPPVFCSDGTCYWHGGFTSPYEGVPDHAYCSSYSGGSCELWTADPAKSCGPDLNCDGKLGLDEIKKFCGANPSLCSQGGGLRDVVHDILYCGLCHRITAAAIAGAACASAARLAIESQPNPPPPGVAVPVVVGAGLACGALEFVGIGAPQIEH